MEKVNFKNSRGLNLVGDFYSADSNAIIIMSHGFTGDRHEGGTFDRTAEALQFAGNSVLNFDFSGSGESDDAFLTIENETDDAHCAVKYVQNKGYTDIGLLGFSLGARIAAKVYDNKIKTMVFWSPVTHPYPFKDLRERFTEEQLTELEKNGYFTYTRDKGIRKKFIVDKSVLDDRARANPKDILSHIPCPVLILQGDKDELVPLEGSEKAMPYLSLESRLIIVPGANHKFEGYLDELISSTVDWFKQYL
ncbi:alpha/beta fold hydrolase [Candidatus Woesearchaeota archaeon]|nr:alpha/beta fold hydrolase [Candidatus Woesearchaeota archaeon]MBW2978911.1 alpha/beta fold hydrolase [Candidatus Woesearchaeota archaeon]